MRIAVVVPALGRPEILDRLLIHLENQDQMPDQVLVSAYDEAHLPTYIPNYPLKSVTGGRGLAAQRNHGLASVLDSCDVATFFDEDFLPAQNYLQRLALCFEMLPDVAAVTGHVAVDGIRGPGLTFDEGLMLLRAAEKSGPPLNEAVDQNGGFGSNLSMRASLIGRLRFNDGPVMGRREHDVELAAQLCTLGRVVRVPSLLGVQLGGKTAGGRATRFGEAQLANLTGMRRNLGTPSRLARRMLADHVPMGPRLAPRADRVGRLKESLIGAYHLLRGRAEPEHVLKQ